MSVEWKAAACKGDVAGRAMRTGVWFACAAGLLSGVAWAQKPPAPEPWPNPASRLFAVPTRRDHIGQVIAPVRIDGKGPFRFLVDTGADGSVVSPRLVRALGLVPEQSTNERVEGTTGTQRLPWVLIERLQIGNIEKRNLRVPVSSSPLLRGLDGILGMAGFGAVRVVIDFQHNRVIIDRSTAGSLQRFGYLDIPARRTPGGLLMIPGRVANIRVTAVIDTGSEGTLGNEALRRALLRAATQRAKKAEIYGVTRQISPGGVAASPTLYLGPVGVRNFPIVYADIPIFHDWHLDSRPALIVGMNVLGTVSTLVLDYPRARVYLLPATSPRISVGTCEIHIGSPLMDSGSDCAAGE